MYVGVTGCSIGREYAPPLVDNVPAKLSHKRVQCAARACQGLRVPHSVNVCASCRSSNLVECHGEGDGEEQKTKEGVRAQPKEVAAIWWRLAERVKYLRRY